MSEAGRIRTAVVGATGYTGREVVRWLGRHPLMARPLLLSARPGAQPEELAPPLSGTVEPLDLARLEGLEAAFLCTPHGVAAALAPELLARGVRVVVDLSPDFRLADPALYPRHYGFQHPAPELLREAVYGLTERARARLPGTRLIANPGCYPTSVLLPLLPLLEAGALDPAAPVVADSKSGVSGAGRQPTHATHFGAVHENFKAYAVGTHRHLPEIHQGAGTDRIAFTPHLLPVFRGILTTLYLRPASGHDAASIRGLLQEAYAGEPFVRVLPDGAFPETAHVTDTNVCAMGIGACAGMVVVVGALDNLVKGAAGQALQNLNAALDMPETMGLLDGRAP